MLFLLLAPAALHAGSALETTDAWIREAPPTVSVMAGYVTLENRGDRPRTLIGAESLVFESVEIHETKVEDGRARMIRRRRLTVPAGGELRLEPGGHHLMLFEPAQRLTVGDEATIVLRFDDGERLQVKAEVRKAAQAHER